MKKLIRMFGFGLFMLCAIGATTSCEKKSSDLAVIVNNDNAPSDVSGMTLKIFNTKGEHVWTIIFTSNLEAQVNRLFSHQNPAPTNAKYAKTGRDSATLHLYASEDRYDMDFSLIFISPNQGIVNTQGLTFTIF